MFIYDCLHLKLQMVVTITTMASDYIVKTASSIQLQSHVIVGSHHVACDCIYNHVCSHKMGILA